MGHVVFAAPSLARFHLHERLAKKLMSRGHRVTVLCTEPVSSALWSLSAIAAALLLPGRAAGPRLPFDELAHQQCLLDGIGSPRPSEVARRARPLRRMAEALVGFFERNDPDLVLLHQERDGLHQLIHFVAREYGIAVLWSGDGLLPGTMQLDGQGLDGDSSACRRPALAYREGARDDGLLQGALSAVLAHALPPPLARTQRKKVATGARARLLARAALNGTLVRARTALRAWEARDPLPEGPPPPLELPRDPFVGVLLQRRDDPRQRLDATGAPAAVELVRATTAAASRLDPALRTVVVLPERCRPRASDFPEAAQVVLAAHAAEVACAAAAVVTVNHPLGAAGLLARTPVLHLGRTPYGVAGVARRTSLATLPDDLRLALAREERCLRERFLQRTLGRDHVWCSADFPDQNGLRGLVLAIEIALADQGQGGAELSYRPGPTWPLACHRRSSTS